MFATNSDLATLNELLTGFYLNGEDWFGDRTVQDKYRAKKRMASADDYIIQDGRAKEMAKAFLKKSKEYGFEYVVEVVWTAQPGALAKAVDPQNKLHLDSHANPSDLVIKFQSVPVGASKFLGLSAKSTTGRNRAGIGFKNPGLGSIERDLHINLQQIVNKGVEEARKNFGLSASAAQRRIEIAKSSRLKKKVDDLGDNVLEQIRDKLYNRLRRMNEDDLRTYIIKDWLDADEVFPSYFKVTGEGNREPFRAKVEDPRDNDKLEAINTSKIKVSQAQRHSIQISAGNIKLFNIRAKFDKQKLAGSVVFSADPL